MSCPQCKKRKPNEVVITIRFEMSGDLEKDRRTAAHALSDTANNADKLLIDAYAKDSQ